MNRLQAIAEYTKYYKYPTSEPHYTDVVTPQNETVHNDKMPTEIQPNEDSDEKMMVDDMMRDMYYAPAHYDSYHEEWRFYLNHGHDGDSKDSRPGPDSYSAEYGSLSGSHKGTSRHSGGYSKMSAGAPGYLVTSGGHSTGSYSGDSSSGGGSYDRHLPEWIVYLQNRHLKYSLASYYGYIPDDHDERPPEPHRPDNTCPLMTDLDRWWISLTHPQRDTGYPGGSSHDGPTGPPRGDSSNGYPTDPFHGYSSNGYPTDSHPGYSTKDQYKPSPTYPGDLMEEWDFRQLRCTQNHNYYSPYADHKDMCPPYWFERMSDIPEFELPPKKHDFAIQYYVVSDKGDPTKYHSPSPPPPRPSPTKHPKQEEALYVLTPLYGWQYVYFGDGYPKPTPYPYPYNTTTAYQYPPYPTGELCSSCNYDSMKNN